MFSTSFEWVSSLRGSLRDSGQAGQEGGAPEKTKADPSGKTGPRDDSFGVGTRGGGETAAGLKAPFGVRASRRYV